MALKVLEGLGKRKRARAAKLGRQFSSEAARDQAEISLLAANNHPVVGDYGISTTEVEQLRAYHAATVEGIAAVNAAGATKKTTNLDYVAAMASGKSARRATIAALRKAERKLRDQETDASDTLADTIASTIAKNSRAGADATLLHAQLVQFGELLKDPAVAAALDAGVLARVAADGTKATAALAAATKTDARLGGVENEDADVLDGLIIEMCREWRADARTAADALGSPAIAAAFELRGLYPPATTKPAKTPGTPS